MLEDPRSARVRAAARLAQKAQRAETGLYLLEGPQALAEALAWRPDVLLDVLVTPTALERHPGLATAAADAGVELEFASEDVVARIADTVTPQGVVATARQAPVAIEDVVGASPSLVVVLEEVRDPGNAGTVIRAADAAGADAVVLTGRSVDLHNPKVVRATTGSLFHLPIAVEQDLDDVVTRCRAAGLAILAADVSGEDLLAARGAGALDGPAAWVFGNEARGLPEHRLAACDRALAVPVYGRAESMNLATAASVCLYESAFAQRVARAAAG